MNKKYLLNLIGIPIYISREKILIKKEEKKEKKAKDLTYLAPQVELPTTKIEEKKEKKEKIFTCDLILILAGGLFIMADINIKNRKNELSLLNNFIKKLGLSISFEKEFTFPLPILPDKSRDSARLQLEKLLFWLRQEHLLKHFLILSDDRELFSFLQNDSHIFSHTLSSMVENPELRRELWQEVCLLLGLS